MLHCLRKVYLVLISKHSCVIISETIIMIAIGNLSGLVDEVLGFGIGPFRIRQHHPRLNQYSQQGSTEEGSRQVLPVDWPSIVKRKKTGVQQSFLSAVVKFGFSTITTFST
jgi:hypothetical protein